jgi:hypothetical protein
MDRNVITFEHCCKAGTLFFLSVYKLSLFETYSWSMSLSKTLEPWTIIHIRHKWKGLGPKLEGYRHEDNHDVDLSSNLWLTQLRGTNMKKK